MNGGNVFTHHYFALYMLKSSQIQFLESDHLMKQNSFLQEKEAKQ